MTQDLLQLSLLVKMWLSVGLDKEGNEHLNLTECLICSPLRNKSDTIVISSVVHIDNYYFAHYIMYYESLHFLTKCIDQKTSLTIHCSLFGMVVPKSA